MLSYVKWPHQAPGYVCRACGTECFNKGAYVRCPVCGIKWS